MVCVSCRSDCNRMRDNRLSEAWWKNTKNHPFWALCAVCAVLDLCRSYSGVQGAGSNEKSSKQCRFYLNQLTSHCNYRVTINTVLQCLISLSTTNLTISMEILVF
jgi:hypothetical protein